MGVLLPVVKNYKNISTTQKVDLKYALTGFMPKLLLFVKMKCLKITKGHQSSHIRQTGKQVCRNIILSFE